MQFLLLTTVSRIENSDCCRLDRGAVLRILDSKDPNDQVAMADAPRFSRFLTEAARTRFDTVRSTLDLLGTDFWF